MDIQMLTQFFMWCTVINAAICTLSGVLCMCASDWMYGIHSKLFSVSRETFNTAIYGFLGFYKVHIMVFNVTPYIVLLIVGN